jgi:hypothetical protein
MRELLCYINNTEKKINRFRAIVSRLLGWGQINKSDKRVDGKG